MKTKRKIAYNILIAFLSVVVTFSLIEGVCSLVLEVLGAPKSTTARFHLNDVWEHERDPFHIPDKKLLWKHIPGYIQGDIRINQQGFRGAEFESRKPQNCYRIVLLGDSITFGFNLPESDILASKLTKRLSENSLSVKGQEIRRIEVINAGVVGYTSAQGRHLFSDQILRFEPDLVVIQFGYNDHHSATKSDQEKLQNLDRDSSFSWFEKTNVYKLSQILTGKIDPRLSNQPVPRVSPTEYQYNLLQMQNMCNANGIDCIFMTVAIRPDIPLVENFTRVKYENKNYWVRQIDFAATLLGPNHRKTLSEHFFRSKSLFVLFEDTAIVQKLEDYANQYPHLAIFPYLLSQYYSYNGLIDKAQNLKKHTLELDTERRQLEQYNALLRELAKNNTIELIDIAEVFDPNLQDQLFLDVVHPNSNGNDLMARTIATYLIDKYKHQD